MPPGIAPGHPYQQSPFGIFVLSVGLASELINPPKKDP